MREKLEAQADSEGMDAMIALLQSIDPEAAQRIHDRKRIIRALEVYYETGETITEHNRRTQAIPPRYSPLWLGLDFADRSELYSRIDLRVDIMLRDGLIDEIRTLLDTGIPPKCTAMQAIGYKEFVDALAGHGTVSDAAAQVKQSSRRYAKRQLTWFRRNPKMHWLIQDSRKDADIILEETRQLLNETDN
jgi:tRNA dimethylallyltransferase